MQKTASARLGAYAASGTAALAKPVVQLDVKPAKAASAALAATAVAADKPTQSLAKAGQLFKSGAVFKLFGAEKSSAPASTSKVHTLNVKPQDQFANTTDRNACGTTSLAMIMDYWYPGRKGNDHFTIDKEIRRADLFSTPDNLARYAESHGLRASVKTEASLSDIKYALDRGLPVQVVIDPDGDKSDFVTHFVVVEGYETDASGKITRLRISDPAGGDKYTLDADTFMKRWTDLHYSGVPSGMSRMMITYAPKDNRPITGLDGVTRRANDIKLPGNSLFHDIFSNSTPARTLGNGISDVVSGAANLDLGTFAGGLVKTVGGAVGTALSIGGGYAQKGGDAAINWANKQWKSGGVLGKIGAVFGWAGGGIAKGVGFAVQKVGNAIGWVAGKVGDGVRKVGNAISDGAKAVGNAIADGAKAVGNAVGSAAKAVGKGIKKIFSGW
ncbi:MAG: C39 family peptidase [Candidatus Sericytochromatia bacterium]|nr:C39 family peptidase [Candidatus Tanganyikabacteria bacterium]